ncbi:MAG: DUF6597 domain-containing transcriptional factor [Flavobacteriales bacterium]
MRFEQFPPPEHLAGVIRCFWTVDSGAEKGAQRSFNTVADGYPGLMVLLPGGAVLHDSEHGEMPVAFLYGQATTCRTLGAKGHLRALGIFFQPQALRSVFGLEAAKLTDACFDLARISGGEALCAALASAVSVDACVELLCAHFTTLLAENAAMQDALVVQAVARIEAVNGDVALPELCAEAGLTERTFERRFKRQVGLPPRLFARIRRFQHTLQQLRAGDYTKLSDVAYANDYADQSHYIRSFKQFTGISPLTFRRDGNEVIENFVELRPD